MGKNILEWIGKKTVSTANIKNPLEKTLVFYQLPVQKEKLLINKNGIVSLDSHRMEKYVHLYQNWDTSSSEELSLLFQHFGILRDIVLESLGWAGKLYTVDKACSARWRYVLTKSQIDSPKLTLQVYIC